MTADRALAEALWWSNPPTPIPAGPTPRDTPKPLNADDGEQPEQPEPWNDDR